MVKKLSQQRDLFESERSFRLLVEGVADYALYMLDPSGIITSWNIGGERIKGYSSEEIVGQHFSRFYTETDRANGKPARALGIARDQGRYEEEGWRCPESGTLADVGPISPVTGRRMDRVADVVEDAIELALTQGCKVDVCVANADLDVLGRIGALLRY